MNWLNVFDAWRAMTPVRSFAPVDVAAVEDALKVYQSIPVELKTLLEATNGLIVGSLKILPIEDPRDIKRTWDSIQRANNPKSTRFLGRSVQLLERFVVFADIGVGRAGVFDRTDGSIWYEEEGDLRQTDLSLLEFIETFVREAAQ